MFATVTHRLNTLLLALLVLMAASIIAIMARRAGAGPLDPPAPPASTNRNIIFEPASCAGFPITISQSGSYTLGSNITMPGGCTFKNGIDITAGNVTLDLNGFAVTGLASNSGSGIAAGASTTNLRLSNGIVSTWSSDAIDFTNASGSSIDHVTASGSGGASGIGLGTTSMLSDCVAAENYTGVAVLGSDSTVTRCSLSGNVNTGVFVGASGSRSRVAGNHASGGNNGYIVQGSNNDVEDNTAIGTGSGGFGMSVSGNGNKVYRNVLSNFASNFYLAGTNDIGPWSAVATATSPWANIVY